jgi:hypothetical protein
MGPLAEQVRVEFTKLHYDVRCTPLKKYLFIATLVLGIALAYPIFLVSALLGRRKDSAVNAHPPAFGVIKDCEFEFKCPKNWYRLKSTSDPAQRYCGSCKRTVHFCTNQAELDAASAQGFCVAIEAPAQRIKLPPLMGARRMPTEKAVTPEPVSPRPQ